ALADECPINASEGNFIRAGFDGELDSLRELARGGKEWIAAYQKKQMDETGIGYNVPMIYEMEGVPDTGRMENIFKQLIKRHESLRTTFHRLENKPVQKVHENVAFKIDDIVGTEHRSVPDLTDFNGLIANFVTHFDLSEAPLMRVGLVKTGENKHLLLVDMHHIITDGASMDVFTREFMELYEGKTLPPLRLQYRDFAQWFNAEQEKEMLRRQEAYWLEQFRDDVPVVELPVDFPRPAVQVFEGARVRFKITGQEFRDLKKLALEENTTLYMVLLAAFNVFLAGVSNQDTVVVGTSVVGRRHADFESIIGMFVNTLALRNFPLGSKPFNQFLEEVNEKTLEVFENQDYPFEQLLEKASVTRNAGRNPLFDVMFSMQTLDNSAVEAAGLTLRPYDFELGIAKFDLLLQAEEAGPQLRMAIEYSTRLFKDSTARRFVNHFKRVLAAVIENPAVRLVEIELISDEEKKKILEEFNDTAADYPRHKTVHRLFAEQVARTGDRIAVAGTESDAPAHLHHLSYRELNEKAVRLAYLLKEKGCTTGSITGIMAEPCIGMVIGILGILKTGGVYLPIDPIYPEERIEYMIKDSGAKVLLKSETNS
ncbi:MAG: AMP-binding protein, partial [bacterium]|nr:AMP-binding protein [bacterium]